MKEKCTHKHFSQVCNECGEDLLEAFKKDVVGEIDKEKILDWNEERQMFFNDGLDKAIELIKKANQ